jgi:excisionase family DNA binding protein
MTLKDVAVFLKVKPVTIYKLLSLKKIPGMKISGTWRFKREMIEEWIDTDCFFTVEKRQRAM